MDTAPNDIAFGWDAEQEDQHLGEMAEITSAIPSLSILAAASEIPENFDPDWFLQDLQAMWPFCHAHMRTGMEECLYYLQQQKYVQFSRRYASIMDMRMDGNDSQPAGASIGGSLRSAIKDGNGPEDDLPYFKPNERYSNVIPSSFRRTSHIKSVIPGIQSYEDLDAAQTSGRALIGFGMDWYSGFSNIGDAGKFDGNPFSGSYLGGHALMFFGWRTINGDRWPLLHNSHPRWGGERRRVALSPRTINLILKKNRFGIYAATDIETTDQAPVARSWEWLLTTHW